MPLDPNIALQVRGLEVPNPMNQLAQVTQIQNALQQQRMGQITMENALREQRREQDVENIMKGFQVGTPVDKQVAALQAGGHFKAAQALQMSHLSQEKERRLAQEAGLKAESARYGLLSQILSGVKDQATLDAVRPQIARLPGVEPSDLQMLQTYDEGLINQLRDRSLTRYQQGSLANQAETARAATARAAAADVAARASASQAETARQGLGIKERALGVQERGNTLQQRRIELDQQRLERDEKRMALDERRVLVAEENQRRQADPQFQSMVERARAAGTAAGKSDQAAVETLPKVISTAEMMSNNIDAMIGKQEVKDPKTGKVIQPATKPHPGFEMTVGATMLPGARFVPGSPAADFQARFEQLNGEAFLQAYETLRGGGHITEVEGKKGTQAINRMSLAQSEKEFVDAAREVQTIIKKGVERAQARVQSAETAPEGPRSATPRGGKAGSSNEPVIVTAPDGKPYAFPTQEQADQFRARIGGGR